MKMKSLSICILLFAMTSLAQSPDGESVQGSDESGTAISIGVIQSLSGIAQSDGQSILNGLLLAKSELEFAQGRELHFIVEDDTSAAKQSLSAYHKLNQVGVSAIIGPTWSFLLDAILMQARRDSLVLFNTSNFIEALDYSRGGGFVFTNALSLQAEAAPFTEYLKAYPAKNALVVYSGSAWGEAQNEAYRKLAEEAGVRLFDSIRLPQPENNDWHVLLPKILSTSAELLILPLSPNDLQVLIRRLNEAAYTGALFSTTHTYFALRESPDPGQFSGLCFSYPLELLRRIDGFYRAYKTRFKEEPKLYSLSSYLAVFLLVEAIKIADDSEKSLAEVLRTEEFRTPLGKVSVSQGYSFSQGRSSLLCVEDGKAVLKK